MCTAFLESFNEGRRDLAARRGQRHIICYTKYPMFYISEICRPIPLHIVIARDTVGFHHFNLRIFNLRVSNPNKSIVDVFLTRCRISMCQGLGPTKTR